MIADSSFPLARLARVRFFPLPRAGERWREGYGAKRTDSCFQRCLAIALTLPSPARGRGEKRAVVRTVFANLAA